ncbi:MAG: YggT family protein [Pseudomonadota bacterium]
MGNPVSSATEFLIRTLFDLYILVVMLRFLLQLVRADFYNPLSQFVVRATNPPLVPLRRLIPGFSGVDVSALLLALALKMAELAIISLVRGASGIDLMALIVVSMADLTQLVVYIFIIAIIIQVVLSWVSPGGYNPMTVLLHHLTEPLMRPARRIVPTFSGLDLSPLVVLIVLQLVLILIVEPLYRLA